jgi:hypothetical protein
MRKKYIKRVNWPWVEIEDGFDGLGGQDSTLVINVNDIIMIWDRSNSSYRYGVRLKDGSWFEPISKDGLNELKDLIMTHKSTHENLLSTILSDNDLDTIYESQELYDWLNEEGQA